MGLIARLLAGIGLHSMTAAGAQAALAEQLWKADHVVLAGVTRSGAEVRFDVRRVYRGDAAGLRFVSGQTLRMEGAGNGVNAERAVLLLRSVGDRAAVHSAAAVYAVDGRDRFAAPGGTVTLAELEALLRQTPFDTRGCGAVTRRGEYLLCTEILHAGTRSQGRRGRLYRNGVEVQGERKGQVVESTAEGARFVFLGVERPHLWSVSGWDLESNPRAPGN